MKAKISLVAALICATIMLAGCSSLPPTQAVSNEVDFPANAPNYVVLGHVELTTSKERSGYSILYAEAKQQYPSCDDVVFVRIDETEDNYIMSGIAIRYDK